jgi:hypothetical protein
MPSDSEHGTTAWLTLSRDWAGAENASRLRDLLVELRAPVHYYEGMTQDTEGQRRRAERDAAIIALLGTYTGARSARDAALARDWDHYTRRTYPLDRAKPSRLDGATSLRYALYKLTGLNEGDALSATQIGRIVAKRP